MDERSYQSPFGPLSPPPPLRTFIALFVCFPMHMLPAGRSSASSMSEDGGPCPDRRRGTAMSTVAGRRRCSLWLRTVTADPSQCGQLTDLGSYAPQIQEHFRKHDFPDAQKGVLTTLSLNLPPPPSR
jgi:hypothetical protein